MGVTGRGRAILLVEDSDDDVELTLRAFSKSGVASDIVVARDGSVRPLSPEIVLLDLKLPEVSGLDVLRRIRADGRTRRQPVVVLTSSKEDSDVVASYELGANSFVRKPVDFGELLQAAQQLGLYWLVLNERGTAP
jgi:two-component system response regulator